MTPKVKDEFFQYMLNYASKCKEIIIHKNIEIKNLKRELAKYKNKE